MNLADAIRRASQQSGGKPVEPTPNPFIANQAETQPGTTTDTNHSHIGVSLRPPVAGASEVHEPNEPSPVVSAGGGSVVRLELFLSPDQVHQMLRGVFQGAHSVMTLREASQYLRASAKSLISLAESGEIPAFMVEDTWKFPRHALDEWIMLQTLKESSPGATEVSDAA